MPNLERYNRNILIDSIGEEGQKRLLLSKALIAGAGGLGSTIIPTLTSVGIGRIGIVDNDLIELSNLNRQFIHKFNNIGKSKVESAKTWINEYNPDTEVDLYQVRFDKDNCEQIIREYDVIVDCFDSYGSKFMLNKACVKNNKILIHGGVAEYFGQVMTIIPEKTACLNCLFPDEAERPYVLKGVISPTVSVIASIQAMEVVKYLLDFTDKNLINTLLCYNGIKQELKKVNISKNVNCPICKIPRQSIRHAV